MRKLSLLLFGFCLLIGDAFAGGKSYSSSSGRSYSSSSSSGSRSFSSSSRSTPSVSRPSTPSVSKPSTNSSSGKSYTSSNKSYSSSTSKPSASSSSSTPRSSYSAKPSGGFQSLAASEQKKAESRAAYQKSTAPKESYTTAKGGTVTINKDDKKVIQVRNLPQEKWVNRETRVETFYHHYYSQPIPVFHYYNDPYNNPYFWMWLTDRAFDDRAYWIYHHRSDMNELRYKELLAKDAKLEARIRELEAKKVAVDPDYVPPGMTDPDLQYDDEYVNAAVNPEAKPISWGGFFHGLWVFIKWCFYLVLIWMVIWLIFFKEWQ